MRASVFQAALMVVVLTVALSGWTASSSTARTPAWNQSLIEKEVKCQHKLSTPGYYWSLGSAVNADAQRSDLYPCADFLGSRTGPNQVSAQMSKDSYQGTTWLNNRKPGELYLLGGDQPPPTGPVPLGPFVAKVNPTTGAQIWRTVLDNANVTGDWIATTELNILADGNIVVAWEHFVVLLDPHTGKILKKASLPTGPAGPIDGHYKHVVVAPDGTLIINQQNRPFGCTTQGSGANITCPGAGGGPKFQANSMTTAVNPKTLQVYDSILMPEVTTVPHIITMFHGKIAIYFCGATNGLNKLYRYFWNPETKKLSQDTSFVVSILSPGQTTGDAPTILGDWVVIQTNGLPAKVASSVVAVNQDDPTKITTIFPYGPLPSGGMSFAPPKNAMDVDNNMIYSDDYGVGQAAGIKFDRQTGQMTAAFVINDRTYCLVTVIGPKNKRVLVITRIDPNATPQQLQNGTYTEQVTWRNAATGQLFAQSAFFAAMTVGAQDAPAFGGGTYFPTNQGFQILQVEPTSGG